MVSFNLCLHGYWLLLSTSKCIEVFFSDQPCYMNTKLLIDFQLLYCVHIGTKLWEKQKNVSVYYGRDQSRIRDIANIRLYPVRCPLYLGL